MYKYDQILMGNEVAALKFLIDECGFDKELALKFLKRYWQKKEYELLALSMETDVTIVEDELKDMNNEIDEKMQEAISKKGK